MARRHDTMLSHLTACLILRLVDFAVAAPTASFPFNAQLPPVARIGQFYAYSLSPNTYQSGSNITYSLGQHPSWLSIENDARRLYGTPKDEEVPAGDVVGQPFEIIATDATGATSMSSTIVVSRNKAPSVQIPLSKQIENFGHFSAPSSILSYPSTSFKYSFDPGTFGVGQNLNYYASSNDNSPLPAWVQFDGPSLTFSGRTPAIESLIQPPETFDFSLVASDIVGFSGTSLSFSIVVGSHKLTSNNTVISLNATKGTELRYDGLEDGIMLDGNPVSPGYLNASVDGIPNWLSYSPDTRLLVGTPKDGDHSTNFTINFQDPFADALNVLVEVNIATGLFRSTLDDIKLRPGDTFKLDLASHFREPDDVDVKVSSDPPQNWLQVSGFQLSGKVPESAKGQFSLDIEATSKSSNLQERESINAFFLSPDGKTTTSASTTISPTSEPTTSISPSTSADPANSHSGRLSTGEILLATIIPVLFIAFVVMLFVCLMRRRRQRRTYLSGKHRAKISGPLPSSLRINGSETGSVYHVAETAGVGKPEMLLFKNGKGMSAEVTSQISSRPRSSHTLGSGYVLEAPPDLMASGARSVTIRSVTTPSEEGERDSWFTVDGTATVGKSDKSSRSRRSETTLPDVAQPFLPTSGFLTQADDGAFRSGLEMAASSFDDLPDMRPVPPMAYNPLSRRRSVGAYSTTTSSSAALPSSFSNNMRTYPKALAKRATESSKELNWETLVEGEAAESISELRRPERARLSSQQWLSRRGPSWHDGDSINDGKSFQTEPSFGSTENWRIIGRRDPSIVYQELVDEAPFNPSRPGTAARDGAQPGERHSSELMSPSKWGEDEQKSMIRPRPSTSMASKLSDGDNSVFGEREAMARAMVTAWKREDSAKASEGSFKMFI